VNGGVLRGLLTSCGAVGAGVGADGRHGVDGRARRVAPAVDAELEAQVPDRDEAAAGGGSQPFRARAHLRPPPITVSQFCVSPPPLQIAKYIP
jgi:hypothetical protein